MSKKCINCGAEIEDIALFCPECGTRQTESDITCPGCGANLKAGSKFCLHCGTPLESPKPVPSQKKGEFEVSMPDENTLSFNILGVSFSMKLIKGGLMGDAELSDFYMGETVVSQALWTTVMGNNPSKDNSDLDYPVTNFNLESVKNFLARLTNITGIEFDIPTGTQFKYVCQEKDEYSDFDNVLEYLKNRDKHRESCMWGDGKLHPVRSLCVEQNGLYDLYDWVQLISDLAPIDENYRILNPRHKEGEYYANKAVIDTFEQYEKPNQSIESYDLYIVNSEIKNYDFATLRLVINIPLDESIKHAFKELETLSKEIYEREYQKETEAQLSLVKKYNTVQASYTPRVYGGDVYIDVDGDVIIKDKKITEVPIHFGIISGNYIIDGCSSLETIGDEEIYPFAVLKSFKCSNCPELECGDGLPRIVFGDVIFKGCHLLEDLGYVEDIFGDLDIRGTAIDMDFLDGRLLHIAGEVRAD